MIDGLHVLKLFILSQAEVTKGCHIIVLILWLAIDWLMMERLPMKRKSKVPIVKVPKQRSVLDRGYEVLTQEFRSGSQKVYPEKISSNSG